MGSLYSDMATWQGSNRRTECWCPQTFLKTGNLLDISIFPSLFQYCHLKGNASLNHEIEGYLLGMMEL